MLNACRELPAEEFENVYITGEQDTGAVSYTHLVITPVALDHTAWLGETLEEIAANKSAIIKHPCTAVSCPSQPEEALAALLERTAAEGVRLLIPRMETAELLEEGPEGSTFVYDGCRIALPLLGDRQRENAVTAVEAARVCLPGLSSRDIEQGLASVRMPCRQELIRREPPLLLDGAHNPQDVYKRQVKRR